MDLNQITIGATDMAASIAFYQTMGLRLIVHTHDRYARFELPAGNATFSLHQVDGPVGPSGMLFYFEVADVDKTVTDLKAKGIAFDSDPVDQTWLWREAYLCDPAGNRICLYHAGEARRYPPWRLKD